MAEKNFFVGDETFVAEIVMLGCNFAPRGFAFCNGQLLPISQNTALFSLLGTYYGGDGKATFALPNMQGMVPIGAGDGPGLTSRYLGETGGQAQVTLTTQELPSHSHVINTRSLALPAGSTNNTSNPTGNYPGAAATTPLYAASAETGSFQAVTASLQALPLGRPAQPVNNMQPFLTINFAIAMQGIFPPRS
jgi:microcystin-dependent protein